MVEKRRRKKARIQLESSSEDESSASEGVSASQSELSEISDDDGAQDIESKPEEQADSTHDEHPRQRIHKAPHYTSTEFNQVFLKLVTEQFGEDLAAMRQANDFGPTSINQLVAGLKEGVNIFTEEQKRML